jgi:DNA-binding HxlR family transcriptional regulator
VNLTRLYDALHFFSHRGTFEILSVLEQRPYRHGALTREVLQHIPSANTVNETLRRLVEAGLVAHEGVWYSLTERGREVLPLTTEYVKSLGWWDEDRSAKTRAPDG